jgi:hypothetical protein
MDSQSVAAIAAHARSCRIVMESFTMFLIVAPHFEFLNV